MFTQDFVRIINAKQKFKIKDKFEFIEFDDISADGLRSTSPIPDHLEIWAIIKTNYTGEIPDSYKALNLIIGDWVEEHNKGISRVIHERLKEHLEEKYPGSLSALDTDDTVVWLDQLDYMPRIDPSDSSIIIEVELIIDTEPLED